MAFPTIQTADTQHNHVGSNSNSWTLTYPTNIAAGNLLLILVGRDGAVGAGESAPGFTALVGNSNGANTLYIWGKVAAGSETGDFTYTVGASEQGSWIIYRITDWYGSDTGTDSNGTARAVTTTGSPSLNPDPPSLNPSFWDVEDTLWFAVCSVDTSRTISVYPLADNNYSDPSGGSTGATLGVCTTDSAVASLDPGTFTISNSDDWVAATIAVRPAVAVPRALPLVQPSNFQNPAIF